MGTSDFRDHWLRRRPLRGLATIVALFAAVLGSGCVTFYQPQRAIHRPVAVERAPTTFEGLRILVRCIAHSKNMPTGDASKLCGSVARELERQGATTEFVVPSGTGYIEPVVFDGERPDLIIEIESKIDHSREDTLGLAISCITYTCVPYQSEQTYSQRVVVFGKDRSILAEEVFRERFVEYTGCGIWSLNWVIDWLFRDDDEDISGDAGKKDFARDFHGQIRQLAYNAKVRSEILGLIPSPRRGTPLPGFAPVRSAPLDIKGAGAQAAPDGDAAATADDGAVERAPAPPERTPTPDLPGFDGIEDPSDVDEN